MRFRSFSLLPSRKWTHGIRRAFRMSFPVIALSVVCGTGWAQQPANKASTIDQTLVTKDDQEIKITYFKSAAGQESPVVILLHGKTSNRMVWKSFAQELQKVDFAVVTVDLRGHGESSGGAGGTTGSSKKPEAPKKGDYLAMVHGDLEAVKRFLFEEHQNKQLNMNKLGIVAADVTAPVAIAYAEFDWEKPDYDDAPTPAQRTPRGRDVQALALLSPEGNVPGLGTNKTLAFLRNFKMPILIAVGSKSPGDLSAATKMHDVLAPKKEGYEMMYLATYDTKLRGTDLLGKGLKTEQNLYTFLIKHVKEHRSEWRDRKSKLLD